MSEDDDTAHDPSDAAAVRRLGDLLDDYHSAVREAAATADGRGESYEAAAADVLAIEAELRALSHSVSRADRRDLLAEFDDVGYVRDLLGLPRRLARRPESE